jgi:hypothetical protein
MRNLKKVLALVLVFAMMLSTVVVASAASFPDVDASYQYSEAIDLLASLNVLGGYEDGTFKAENNITRAEFSKVLYVVFNGMDDVTGSMFKGTSQFTDVAKDAWFNGNVNWASENAIVGGYGDGTFLPNNNVAVKEAIKMVVTCVTDKSLTYPNGYIQEAKAQKLLDDVTISSIDAPATRGQVAQLVYNLLYTKCRLCLKATGQYNTDANGNNVEVYEKVAPIEFVFDLTATGGTEDDDADVTLLSTYDNSWTGSNPTTEEGYITLSIDGTPKTYEYANDVSDLFGQKLVAYTNSKDELVSLVSVSEVMTTTLDKCSGDGSTTYPYGVKVGEYSTSSDGTSKFYTLDNVYYQNANGVYTAVRATTSVKDGSSTKNVVKLADVFAQKGFNAANPVTFIDYDADGTYETMVVDYVGYAKVTRCTSSTKTMTLGATTVSFDNATGYEAFVGLDYSDSTKNPVYANYTVKQNGVGTKIYDLSVAKTAEGLLTSVDSTTGNLSAVIGGTTYKAVGAVSASAVSSALASANFTSVSGNTDETVKVYLNDAGYVIAVVVTDESASYELNLAKVIAASDSADKWGNNVVATLTVVLPDGTQKVLTLDTTLDSKTSDTTTVKVVGTLADLVSSNYDAENAKLTDATDNEVFFAYDTKEAEYKIVGQYIHYELDDDTNQVVRLVAASDLESYQPTGSSKTYEVDTYSANLCYDATSGFFVGDEDKVTTLLGAPADDFVGMYYEENEDGEIEAFYYTASNIPEFYNEGKYTLITADGDVVAMIVTESPDATASDKVLGVITGFSRVSGEAQKNGKNTYRIAITMWVNGETQTYYTEDAVASAVPNTDYDDDSYTGLTTGRFVELQLKTNGKVNVADNEIDVHYLENGDDVTFAYATTVRGSLIKATSVTDFSNAVVAGWAFDEASGEMVYNEEGKVGTVAGSVTTTLRTCDETTIITVTGTPVDIDDAVLFQSVATANLSKGGTVETSDTTNGLYYLFAYNVFADGEPSDNDNVGAVKTLIVFTTPIDAPAE